MSDLRETDPGRCHQCNQPDAVPNIQPYWIGSEKRHIWLHPGPCARRYHARNGQGGDHGGQRGKP